MPRKSHPPDTSLAAWRSINKDQISEHHGKIIKALTELKYATAEQIASRTNLSYPQVSRRMSELEAKNEIGKTGIKSRTSTGRMANVYTLTANPLIQTQPIQNDLFNN